jgi:hypothetical protein
MSDQKIFELKQKEMPKDELIKKIRDELSKLCRTGGRSLSMSVPPSVDDFDMLVCEAMDRLEGKN